MVIIDRTRCGLSCETGAVLFYPYLTQISLLYRLSGKNKGQWLYFIVELWMEWKTKNIKNSLGAMWNASHLAVWLCALRHWKRVSMPQTTHSHRHPLTRAIHIAPRKKTTRRFTAKNQFLGTAYNYNKTLNTIYMVQKKRIFARFYHAWCTGVSFYLSYLIIRFLKIGFSPKASGYYPFGDASTS